LTVVEINPGYLEIIPKYEMVKSLLSNPKIEIVIDDGRRWLFRNSERRFDAVIMNTTWHYRAFATNLLSVEFLNLVRSHLNPGGIFFYNTTFSNEAQRTGATVFPYAYKFINFLVASDSPIMVDTERLTRTLKDYTIDGNPVLKLPEDRSKLEEILGILASVDQDRRWPLEMESRDHILARTAGLGIITDDNMLTEWRGKD
jgi:spermidine synthase